MSQPASPMPTFSFYEDATLSVPKSDKKLRRWGSVQEACRILDDCDREIIYDLIATGGTATAAVQLLQQLGAEVVAAVFVSSL